MTSDETTVTQQTYEQSPVHYPDQPVTFGDSTSVTTDTYTATADTYNDSIQGQITAGLNDFYHSHVEGSIQIFHSLTLGEILIIILLAAILIVLVARWIWEVV